MSTLWYLECHTHAPVIRSDEISQHTDFRLDIARKLWAHRKPLGALEDLIDSENLGDFSPGFGQGDFESNSAWRFIRQHPECDVRLRSEYGDVQSIAAAADTEEARETA